MGRIGGLLPGVQSLGREEIINLIINTYRSGMAPD